MAVQWAPRDSHIYRKSSRSCLGHGRIKTRGRFPRFRDVSSFRIHALLVPFREEPMPTEPSNDDLREFINKTSGCYRLQICISKITVCGARWSRRGNFRYYQKIVQLLTDRSISMSSVQQAAGLYSPKIW